MPPDDQVRTARARVAALRRRSGWVPRVPDRARGRQRPANPGGARAAEAPAADGQGTPSLRRRPGRHARPAEGQPGGPPDGPGSDSVDPAVLLSGGPDQPTGEPGPSEAPDQPTEALEQPDIAVRRGPVAAAVADRLPLLVRPLVQSLPAGVRRGRFGLLPSHALVIVLVLLLGLAVTALLTGLGRPKVSAVQPAATATVLATGTPIARDEPEEHDVVVHVVGKVGSPGLVDLPAGSRVADALEAAGGADEGVDLSTLNLARLVSDGEQIFVGVDPPPEAMVGPDAGSGGQPLVNINTAAPEQLETLPGIGPTLADRIVEWRERHGRFSAIEELLEVSGIGQAKLEAMAELVTL